MRALFTRVHRYELRANNTEDLVVHTHDRTEHLSAAKGRATWVPDCGLAKLRESAPVATVVLIYVERTISDRDGATDQLAAG